MHVVRLRILACRNDLNRKRIVSLQLTAHSSQLTADSFYLLTAFPTTVIDSSLALRMTPFVLRHYDAFRSPLLVTCFPQIVILNGGKNALWEKRETGQ